MTDGRRCALVTGAAGGIGRSIAITLADGGWAIAAADRDDRVASVAREIEARGGDALPLVFDVADEDACERAHAEAAEVLGPVACVVANAAVVDHIRSAERTSAEAWRREVDVNLTGAFLSIRPALAQMVERGDGRVVVVSSGAATGGLRGQVSYAASKAGLLGMVRTLALELASAGVTVNAVLPGMVETEKVASMPADVRARATARVPFGRFATTEEIAHVVAFLASPAASYVTGAWLPVDGAMSLNDLTLGREDPGPMRVS